MPSPNSESNGSFECSPFLALELKFGWLDGAAGMIVASGCKLG